MGGRVIGPTAQIARPVIAADVDALAIRCGALLDGRRSG